MARINVIGEPFVELSEVDSSNNYAMQQVQAQLAEHGSTYFTHYQNKGKGQRGKSWNAERGQNIMMSCVLRPDFVHIDYKFVVSACIALACCEFFEAHALDQTSIKWPNDIYWKDRKAGGILVENVLTGKEWKYAIAGMGININQTLFSDLLPNPVSLKQITGKNFDTIALAKELCSHLQHWWNVLQTHAATQIIAHFNNRLYKRNQLVNFKTGEATFSAMVKGVDISGSLIVDTGEISRLQYGSLEWIG